LAQRLAFFFYRITGTLAKLGDLLLFADSAVPAGRRRQRLGRLFMAVPFLMPVPAISRSVKVASSDFLRLSHERFASVALASESAERISVRLTRSPGRRQ
jgi:hypothetical protein